MSDENDLELKFGADASGVQAGADVTNASIESISQSMAALTASVETMNETMTASFAQLAASEEQVAESTAEMAQATEAETASLLEMAAAAREGVESLNEMKESVVGFGELILAAFAVEAIVDFVKEMGEAAEQVVHTAQAFGMTTGEVQKLQAVFTAAGAGPEALSNAMARLERAASNAVSGNARAADAFKLLGVNLNEAMTPAQRMQEVLQGFGNIPGPERAAVAFAIFGRSIQTIAPMLGMTSEAFKEFSDKAVEFGAVSDDAVAKGDALGESLNMQKVAMMGLGNVMAEALAPAFTVAAQGVTTIVAAFTKSYEEGGLVRVVMETLGVVVKVVETAFVALGLVLSAAADEFALAGRGVQMVGEFLVSVGKLVIQFGAAFVDAFNIITDNAIPKSIAALQGLLSAASGVFQGIFSWIGRVATAMFKWIETIPGVGPMVKQAGAAFSAFFAGVTKDATNAYESVKAIWGPDQKAILPPGGGAGTPPTLGGPKEKKDTGAEDALQAAREAFEEEEAAHRGMINDMTADELAFWLKYKESAEYAALTDKQQAEVRLNISKLERAQDLENINDTLAAKKNAAAEAIASIQQELQQSEAASAEKIRDIEAKEKEGVISRQAALVQIKEIITQELVAATSAADQILMKRIEVDEAITAVAAQGTTQYKEAMADEIKANDERNKAVETATINANKAIQESTNQTTEATLAAYKKMFTSIGDFAVSTTEGLIKGNETWQQAYYKVLDGMLDMFLKFVEQQIVKWAAGEAAKTGLSQTWAALQQALGLTTAASAAATSAASSIAQVTNAAAVGAANAAASTAAIPIVGPELAPAAAAAMASEIEAFSALIGASALGGYDIPSGINPIVQTHAEEMILPANIANPLRSALRTGGLSQAPTASSLATQAAGSSEDGAQAKSGGDTHLHVHAMDAKGVAAFLMANKHAVAAAVRGSARTRMVV